jgi:phage gp29-like protein
MEIKIRRSWVFSDLALPLAAEHKKVLSRADRKGLLTRYKAIGQRAETHKKAPYKAEWTQRFCDPIRLCTALGSLLRFSSDSLRLLD